MSTRLTAEGNCETWGEGQALRTDTHKVRRQNKWSNSRFVVYPPFVVGMTLSVEWRVLVKLMI